MRSTTDTDAAARPQLVVGTAGHIDHGKSRLVRALTGEDPDRLPEEQARGMTIELGFAYAELDGCDVWFVDVPGHERFIRTMVAGAAGVDAALLIVAADDSVMPQTREHAELLELLGVERCLIVLTKLDLVDDEWADAVEEEARELLAGLRIEPLACLRTSAETGRGVDEVKAALARLARGPKTAGSAYKWFRLPIDRAFTISGRGTVVTGSVMHGALQRDQELELWPTGRRVRARDLQTHHEGRAAAAGRMRLAVNLAGVSLAEVRRGCELATPGYLRPSRRLDVRLATLRSPGKTLRKRVRLRLHLATTEVLAELRLLEKPDARQTNEVFGQLVTREPIVASWGQHFIVRDEADTRTLGGGQVLRPFARTWTRKRPPHEQGLRALFDGPQHERLEEIVRAQEWPDADERRLAEAAGVADADEIAPLVRRLGVEGRVRLLCENVADGLVHRNLLESVAAGVNERLARKVAENPRWPGAALSEWPSWMPRACPLKLRPVLGQWLIEDHQVSVVRGFVLPRDHVAAMAPADESLYETVLCEFERGAFQPPAAETLTCRTGKNGTRIDELIGLALARGDLRLISEGLLLHRDRWTELVDKTTAAIRDAGPRTVSEIRTLLGSSRKYVVPLLEALDAAGVTKRVGDKRTLGPQARSPQ